MTPSENVSKWVFRLSLTLILALVAVSAGFVVGAFKLPPHKTVMEAVDAAHSLLRFGAVVPKGRLMTAPEDASREAFTTHSPERMVEGFYVFLGWDDRLGRYSAWLYRHDGTLSHTWGLSDAAMGVVTDGTPEMPHGFMVLRDGSLLANYSAASGVLARIDSCGKSIWHKKGYYHHSLQRAEDGSYWTWRGESHGFAQYQYLENFDPETGAELNSIGLVEDIIRNRRGDSYAFLLRPDYGFEEFGIDQRRKDIFHPNDIDVLTSDLAPMFPDFEAGDLLISLRRLNLVAVIDPETAVVKWFSHGPWRAQHDPDFTPDGKISVYNNNSGLRRSEIIKIDPQTREVSNDLASGGLHFYSAAMGKHQYLPNGNVLVVVPGEGRILVASGDGQPVLEFNNLSVRDGAYNAHVENGYWLPPDYFTQLPECAGSE